jgi:phosphate/sulfate permease
MADFGFLSFNHGANDTQKISVLSFWPSRGSGTPVAAAPLWVVCAVGCLVYGHMLGGWSI